MRTGMGCLVVIVVMSGGFQSGMVLGEDSVVISTEPEEWTEIRMRPWR